MPSELLALTDRGMYGFFSSYMHTLLGVAVSAIETVTTSNLEKGDNSTALNILLLPPQSS